MAHIKLEKTTREVTIVLDSVRTYTLEITKTNILEYRIFNSLNALNVCISFERKYLEDTIMDYLTLNNNGTLLANAVQVYSPCNVPSVSNASVVMLGKMVSQYREDNEKRMQGKNKAIIRALWDALLQSDYLFDIV